jgi:predicted TIM-barrel fold metal-dependent hydrolase
MSAFWAESSRWGRPGERGGLAAVGHPRPRRSAGRKGVQARLFTDAARSSALAGQMNDALAERVRLHPDRLHGLGCVAPQDPAAAADEIGRIMGTLDLKGRVRSQVQGEAGAPERRKRARRRG